MSTFIKNDSVVFSCSLRSWLLIILTATHPYIFTHISSLRQVHACMKYKYSHIMIFMEIVFALLLIARMNNITAMCVFALKVTNDLINKNMSIHHNHALCVANDLRTQYIYRNCYVLLSSLHIPFACSLFPVLNFRKNGIQTSSTKINLFYRFYSNFPS